MIPNCKSLASDDVEKVPRSALADLMPGVEAGDSVVIGHSNDLELEIDINCTYPNGETTVK